MGLISCDSMEDQGVGGDEGCCRIARDSSDPGQGIRLRLQRVSQPADATSRLSDGRLQAVDDGFGVSAERDPALLFLLESLLFESERSIASAEHLDPSISLRAVDNFNNGLTHLVILR